MSAGKVDVARWLAVDAKAVATTRSLRHVQSVIEDMQAAIRDLAAASAVEPAERGEAVVRLVVRGHKAAGWEFKRLLPDGGYDLYTAPPPAAGVPDESVASFVEEAGAIIGGKPFPDGKSLSKAREICDLALTMLCAAKQAGQ